MKPLSVKHSAQNLAQSKYTNNVNYSQFLKSPPYLWMSSLTQCPYLSWKYEAWPRGLARGAEINVERYSKNLFSGGEVNKGKIKLFGIKGRYFKGDVSTGSLSLSCSAEARKINLDHEDLLIFSNNNK